MPTPPTAFDNSYARELPGFYVRCRPKAVPAPTLLFFNRELARELQLGLDDCDDATLAGIFCGKNLPEGADPIAQAYAGHQFGHFNPRLGDGRALVLGEVIDVHGQRRDIALKGSGATPFSRGADGKAALGPMLREVLLGEAMHALGIPSTRALAVVGTGETVYRESPLPGAILTRIASSHLRVGTFQFAMNHSGAEQLHRLADYAITRHYPEALQTANPYIAFLEAAAERQAALLARWMHAGFIHGVMNTDNMSIAGETIDYGPCAFLEAYDPQAVFSSIDHMGRYAYGQQPHIARWNLARFAETLLPLIDDDEARAITLASSVIDVFPARYRHHWLDGLREKLGIANDAGYSDDADMTLGESWLELLHRQKVDFTLGWRHLADAADGNEAPLRRLFADQAELDHWLLRWRERRALHADGSASVQAMRNASPWIIPRNQHVEEALAAASGSGDLDPFRKLFHAVRHPYEEDPTLAIYAEPATRDFMSGFQTFCGT